MRRRPILVFLFLPYIHMLPFFATFVPSMYSISYPPTLILFPPVKLLPSSTVCILPYMPSTSILPSLYILPRSPFPPIRSYNFSSICSCSTSEIKLLSHHWP
ncbi:hypothetical protein C8J57DRAFT_1360601 [Mycena rebaudengoi]|nr:hypothetical protein C8J57DRAFT_1360601 [Mycena rebaudengoi]